MKPYGDKDHTPEIAPHPSCWVAIYEWPYESTEIIGVSMTLDGAKEYCETDEYHDVKSMHWAENGPQNWTTGNGSLDSFYRIEEHELIMDMG